MTPEAAQDAEYCGTFRTYGPSIILGELVAANHAESRIFPGGHKAIDAVPAVEGSPSAASFSRAEHFITGPVAATHRFGSPAMVRPERSRKPKRDMPAGR